MPDKSKYLTLVKPTIDFFTGLLLLIVFSPIMLVIALILKLSRVPVFFIHDRPGKKGHPFGVMKFTTMLENREFRFGKFLRKISLDELPQLLNVVRGQMSFVGPRPLLTEYMATYTEGQKLRHLVKPGITGLAQVNGRNAIDLERKLELDMHYVRNVSFFLDMKIMVKTIVQLFRVGEADYHDVTSRDLRQKIG